MTKQPSFEVLMAEIDTLVAQLESPDTGIEDSLKIFELGSQRIADARKRLKVIEHQFEILKTKFGEDTPDDQPKAPTPTDEPQESLGL